MMGVCNLLFHYVYNKLSSDDVLSYDIAVVIKRNNGKLYVLDATGDGGVEMYDVSEYIDRVRYVEISMRHIKHDMPESHIEEKIEQFINLHIGKPYKNDKMQVRNRLNLKLYTFS